MCIAVIKVIINSFLFSSFFSYFFFVFLFLFFVFLQVDNIFFSKGAIHSLPDYKGRTARDLCKEVDNVSSYLEFFFLYMNKFSRNVIKSSRDGNKEQVVCSNNLTELK